MDIALSIAAVVGATAAYLVIGIGMSDRYDRLDTWESRLSVILWPVGAMFGILFAVGRLFREVLLWSVGGD